MCNEANSRIQYSEICNLKYKTVIRIVFKTIHSRIQILNDTIQNIKNHNFKLYDFII